MTPRVDSLTLRHATPADLSAVDALMARSYPRLLARDYAPSVMVLAVPIICRARPELLASGRYWLAEGDRGRVIAAGGWSVRHALAAVRHVATDPDAVRRGVGRALMGRVMEEAREAGFTGMECLSTLTAVRFYAAVGFRALGPVRVNLAPGIDFPAVRMIRDLA